MAESMGALTDGASSFTIDGKTYTFSALTLGDHLELVEWVQDRYIKAVQRLAKKHSPAQAEVLISDAIKTAAGIDTASYEYRIARSSVEGEIRTLWLKLRRNHPEVSIDQVYAWIMDAVSAKEVREADERQKRSAASDPKGAEPKSPTPNP